jgi:hypothetical protein
VCAKIATYFRAFWRTAREIDGVCCLERTPNSLLPVCHSREIGKSDFCIQLFSRAPEASRT